MKKYFFMRSFIDLLAGVQFMHGLVALTLRIVAGLVVLFSLVGFFHAGKVIFELPPSGILGGIAFQVCFVLAVYAVAHACVIRAGDVERLGPDVGSIFPMTSLLLKLSGETLSAFTAFMAVGGGVYVWFTGKSVATIVGPLPMAFAALGDTTFMGGIEFMVGGVLAAVGGLVIFYVLAEVMDLVSAFADG
jgi:hypothetical protein